MRRPGHLGARWPIGLMLLASLTSPPASAQDFNSPLPGLVVRDSAGTLVGQLLRYADPLLNPPPQILVSTAGQKVVLELANQLDPDLYLQSPASVWYPGSDCVGLPMMEFSDSVAEIKLRGVSHAIGAEGVVYQVNEASPDCSSSTAFSRSSRFGLPAGSCHNLPMAPVIDCKVAQPTDIDLSLLQPPFRVE